MPLYKELITNDYSIYTWRISELGHELSKGLPKLVNTQILLNNKLQKRRVEKSVQMHLLIYAGIDPLLLSYASSGKPFIRNSEEHVSFSHSGKYAALMVSKTPCGIDLEQDNPIIKRISSKFLNKNETYFLSQPGALNWIWGIKEAVFKYFGSQVIFKHDIIVDRLDPDLLTARVSYQGCHGAGKFEMNLVRFENYYLAYTKAYQAL